MATVLIITDSYPPEIRSSSHLMGELAEGLARRGYKVSVVTSYPSHNLVGATRDFSEISLENGVRVVRIKLPRHHNVNLFAKGFAQIMMSRLFARKAISVAGEKIGCVIVHSPPLPLVRVGTQIKKLLGAKFVLNLHDFFPQNAVDLGLLKNPFAVGFFRRMEEKAYRSADVIVTPSRKHLTFLRDRRAVDRDKARVIPHWIDLEPFKDAVRTGKFRKAFGLDGRFVFIFAGNLGPSQALETVIGAAQKLQNLENIRFLFAGEGSEKKKLMRLAKNLRLPNVVFRPLVPKEEYPLLLKDVDAGLATLSVKNSTPAVPAKLMGYMAARLPVAAFLHKESEGLDIVREAQCGYAFASNDAELMAETVARMYKEKDKLKELGENGFQYLLSRFTEEVCLNQWEEILNG